MRWRAWRRRSASGARETTIPNASVEDILGSEPAASSRPRGWYGVEVFRTAIDDDALDVDDLRAHTIALNVGDAYRLEGRVDGSDASAMMHPNTFKIIPARVASRWRWRAASPIEMLHLSVPEETLGRFFEECEVRPAEIRTSVGVVDPVVTRLAAGLNAEIAADAWRGRLYAQTLAQDLVVHLVRTFSSNSALRFDPPGQIGKRAMLELDEYIDAHLSDPLTLEQLAGVTRLSRFHFARLFRRSVRVTPHQYVLERRLLRAFRLIRGTSLPLRDIAAIVGLADQSHLTRLIRRRYGTTPARLRLEAR